jgi:hypothetical protein
MQTILDAKTYVQMLLAEMPDRWHHVEAVAAYADEVSTQLMLSEDEHQVCVMAAWLHDIGYTPSLAKTGFHHLDGALHLRELGLGRIASIVAYHSSGQDEAFYRGLADDLASFAPDLSLASDCVTYADMSIGPNGQRMRLEARIGEITTRYGNSHVVSRGIHTAAPRLRAIFTNINQRLSMTHQHFTVYPLVPLEWSSAKADDDNRAPRTTPLPVQS